MASNNSYEQQFLTNFDLLVGADQGLRERDFIEIVSNLPNPAPTEEIIAAFKRHSDNGKVIDCDCMLEAVAELTESTNASLISMNLVQTIERIQWKKIFQLVDEDGSGRVDIHELKSFVDALDTVMSLQGYNTQDAAKMMREAVGSGSSELDFDMFITVTRRLTKGTPVITLVEKVDEAKRAVRDRKATALNLFQTRVLTSMLRKRGTTISRRPHSSSAANDSARQHVDPFEETIRSVSEPPQASPSKQDANNNNNANESPSSGATYEFETQQFLRVPSVKSVISPTDIHSSSVELARYLSSDPIRNFSGISLSSSHPATLGRVAAVAHNHDSARILGLLDQYCKNQDDKKVFDAGKISKHVSDLCNGIVDSINGPPGTLFEMQRAAVSRAMEVCNEFLTKVSPKPSTNIGGINVPNLNLNNNNQQQNAGNRERTTSVISSGSGQGRSRARTIMENTFGKEQLHEMARDKLNDVLEARREVAGAQEDIDYAIDQIILPRNKVVELAMSLIPHARNPTTLANAIRRFELQTQELHDCLAYFRFFADFTTSSAEDGDDGIFGGNLNQSNSINPDSTNNSARASKKPSTPKFSIAEMMKIVQNERWADTPPSQPSEAFNDLMAEATVHVSFVTQHLFRNVSNPTIWIKELSDAASDLAMHVKGLACNYLRDRAVQTPTELIIGLQNFPVSFSMSKTSNSHDNDDDKSESTLREKRRIALAQARIRRNLVADITKERAAESVDLLIKRYLSAGVIVPPNFGRVISTDPAKQKRHTFRFGSKLIDLTPMDDRLAVHSCGGFMYFDEYCGKFTDLECRRMQRESKRGNFSVGMMSFQDEGRSASTMTSGSSSSHQRGRRNSNSPTSSISAAMAAYQAGQQHLSSGNSRSTSTMTNPHQHQRERELGNNSFAQSGSPLNLRSNSAYSHTSHYSNSNSNSTHHKDTVVEFTVRSGSPVQVVPFPGLAEANQKNITQLAQKEMDSRSSSTNSRSGIGMVPSHEIAAQKERERELLKQRKESADARVAAAQNSASKNGNKTAAENASFTSNHSASSPPSATTGVNNGSMTSPKKHVGFASF